MKRYIRSNAQVDTYRGIHIGMEDSADNRYYFLKDKDMCYADNLEELKAKIDDWLDSQDKYISSATTLNIQLLKDLAEDMLYQVYEEEPESSLKEAQDLVLDIVIDVITDMDDDEIYAELLPYASYDNKKFCSAVRKIVKDEYDQYDWWVE